MFGAFTEKSIVLVSQRKKYLVNTALQHKKPYTIERAKKGKNMMHVGLGGISRLCDISIYFL